MKITITDFLAKQQNGEMSYADIAEATGIHPQYAYWLGAQDLRARWSACFCGLSPRIRNTLAAANISTVEEVAEKHATLQLLNVPNLGMKSFREIGRWLHAPTPAHVPHRGSLQ